MLGWLLFVRLRAFLVAAARHLDPGRPRYLLVPILVGCVLYVVMSNVAMPHGTRLNVAVTIIFCIRAAAIRWHIEMPGWLTNRHD